MFYRFVVWIVRVVLYFIMPMKVIGAEKVVYDKGVILAGNHQSNWDPVFVALAYKKKMNYMAKKELFTFKPFGKLLSALGAFPVDRGNADLKAIKTAMGILKSGKPMLMFPEGTRVHEGDQVQVKNGVAMFALKTKTPIQPVGLFGAFKPFRRTYVVFGDPIGYDMYYDSKIDNALLSTVSDDVLNKIRKIIADTKKDLQIPEK